ncbi:MAG: 2Fe-2S iron-sulfur cluster-binding protein [Desulfurococcaceae archaeon]
MVKVRVNNIEVDVPENSYIIEAIEKAGFRVPLLCYLQGLFNEATCRLCVVKVNGKIAPSCRYPVQDGVVVETSDSELETIRKINFELILATHRINCWDCTRKSYCILVSISKELGVEGIPVCSECPMHDDQCFTRQGITCLGPLTHAGCKAECILASTPCIGCRGFINNTSIWRNALRFYRENNISKKDLENTMSIFWHSLSSKLREIIEEVYGE